MYYEHYVMSTTIREGASTLLYHWSNTKPKFNYTSFLATLIKKKF